MIYKNKIYLILFYLIIIFFKFDNSDISFPNDVTGGFNKNIELNSFNPGAFIII